MKKNYTPLLFIMIAILGAFLAAGIGESWDEPKFFIYANMALNAYKTWPETGTVQTFGISYDNYGPVFIMLVSLLTKNINNFLVEAYARHYLYFLTFLAGAWAFHELAMRWLSKNAALFSTLLFLTQPLLVGHAFINPKDIPFLSFFIIALMSGLKLFDSLNPIDLKEMNPRAKKTLTILSALWVALVLGLFLFTDSYHSLLATLVEAAKTGKTNIISLVASDIYKVPAEIYIQRYFIFFLWFRSTVFLIATSIFIFSSLRILPKPALRSILSIVFPAILLGFTTSIRILGPFAAIFVMYYAFRKLGKHAFLPLIIYGLIAVIFMYLTWPYLWTSPIGHFIESAQIMSKYPRTSPVLFNGIQSSPMDLPYSYLPVLFGIQLTEPVWVLAMIGFFIASFRLKEMREPLWLSIVWFVIPLIGFIVMRNTLYDNTRQVLFILPPLFLMAGVTLEMITNIKWQIALAVLCLIPGVIGIAKLHPYEYIYYNQFIGGMDGAQGKFEMDYWGASYREAAEYVNKIAPANAVIWVEGPSHLFELYAREDLKIFSDYELERADRYDYVVATTRYDLDKISYPNAKIIYKIARGEAILAVIKQP